MRFIKSKEQLNLRNDRLDIVGRELRETLGIDISGVFGLSLQALREAPTQNSKRNVIDIHRLLREMEEGLKYK